MADPPFGAGSEGSDGGPAPRPTFGRTDELGAVDWLLAGPVRGEGRVLILEGEAGLGKSHLAEVAVARAMEHGFTTLIAGADELETDRPGALLRGWSGARGAALSDPAAETDAAGGRGFAAIEAIGDELEDAASTGPVLVVAEDLHWADELSLRGLASIARRLAPLPVAMVLTLRPWPRPSLLGRVLAAVHSAPTRHLHLTPLEEDAVTSMVVAETGSPPGATLSRRIGGAAGNPLYVLELLRALRADGALQQADDVVEVGEIELSESLRRTILDRLGGLPPATAELLRLASLLGRHFRLADLAAWTGRPEVELAVELRAAVDAAVLAGEGESLSFRHDLMREAVYDDIAPAIRGDLHHAAGRALATAQAPPARVAHQLVRGARPGDDLAIEWIERAAADGLGLDPAAAVALLTQALELTVEDTAARDRVEAAMLDPLAHCGRVDEARSRAVALLDRNLDPTVRVRVRLGLTVVAAASGDLVASSQELARAAGLPGLPEPQAAVLRGLSASMALLTGGPASEAEEVARRTLSLPLPEPDRAAARCVALQSLALVAGVQAHYGEAFEQARASRRLMREHAVAAAGFLIPDVWEGTFLLYADRVDEAVEAYERSRERAARRGEVSLLVHTHGSLGLVHYLSGRWDDAVSELEAGVAVAGESGNHAHLRASHALLARIARARGSMVDVVQHLAAAGAPPAQGGHLVGTDLIALAQAGGHEADGDPEAALGRLAASWDRTAPIRGLDQFRTIGPELVRLAVVVGDLERAGAVARQLDDLATASGATSAAAAAMWAQGMVEGDAGLLLDAAAAQRTSFRRVELAATLEDAGRALLARSDAVAAADLLDEAVAIHLECGADVAVARCDALLRQHGIRRRRHGPAPATRGWDALSPTERKVVALVAQGLSNPQIGESLFISRRTVETHVSHVFRKLDVHNRAQLAVLAAERSDPG